MNTSVSPQPAVIPTPQATRNPPPLPAPYKTGPQARKATSRAPHLSLMPLSLPCPKQQSKRDRATRTANSKASATQQTTQQPQLAPPHLKPRMGTDGEGRRNPARLCTTAVRRLGSPPPITRTPSKAVHWFNVDTPKYRPKKRRRTARWR